MKITDYTKTSKYDDEDVEIFSVAANNKTVTRGRHKNESICVIPFDMNEQNQISGIYLAKHFDFTANTNIHSAVTEDFDPSSDSDSYETFMRSVNKDLGLSDSSIPDDASYYLGKICHNFPYHKTYHCYALNVTNLANTPQGFKPKLPKEETDAKLYTIDRVKFNRVVKGEVNDSLTLAGTLLLISYLS